MIGIVCKKKNTHTLTQCGLFNQYKYDNVDWIPGSLGTNDNDCMSSQIII